MKRVRGRVCLYRAGCESSTESDLYSYQCSIIGISCYVICQRAQSVPLRVTVGKSNLSGSQPVVVQQTQKSILSTEFPLISA